MKRTPSETVRAAREAATESSDVHLGPLSDLLGYSLRRAQLAVFQDFIVRMKGFDLRPAQFSVLAIIQANPGLRQSRISEALGINRANFVALLDELERRRLARRAPSQEDRRSNALYLTPKGKALLTEALQHLRAEHESRLEDVLGARGKHQLLAMLQKLTKLD